MNRIAVFCAAATLSAACAYAASPRAKVSPEAQLAQALAGRIEGPTTSCVSMRRLGGNRSIGEDVILFGGQTSSTVYVNRPAAGCPSLKWSNALKVRTTQAQLCRGDIAEVFDPTSGVTYGACGLGDFTEYRRASYRR